ncbi:hypothetical protein B0H66DRAFT_42412 [Apodospora peruviana]|uniref:Amidohydrolase-related domain-containing protein n=1 Tax=Apodospora peruviana TaxID=516989 RepID=A0AAE0MFN9_9PEZI|nr:hypothetical protein B0H66DRAFT_42412 [Apodospora peruviana]
MATMWILFTLLVGTACSCHLHIDHSSEPNSLSLMIERNYTSIISNNMANRHLSRNLTHHHKTALINVRIFDGTTLQAPSTLIIDGDRIGPRCHDTSPHPCGATSVYDAQGKALLPGLIDSHAHPLTISDLESLTRAGVTTAVLAHCPDPALCASLSNQPPGLTSIVTGSFIATTPDSQHALTLLSPNQTNLLIRSLNDTAPFIANQVAHGAEFIKIIGSAPGPGLSQDMQSALVAAAHRHNRQAIAHASSALAYTQAAQAGVDQIHHAPLDVPLPASFVTPHVRSFKAVCPTLTMMRGIASLGSGNFSVALESVRMLHEAGVKVLAGTDANGNGRTPFQVRFGTSLHDELENLVLSRLTPVQALNAAARVPAEVWGLMDKGVIREGKMADLILVDGDPSVDVRDVRRVVKVWARGVEFVGI